jgi:hypothetical protein
MMIKILIYILFAYGLSNLLVFGMGPYDLLDWIRNTAKKVFGKLGNMLDCMMCTSFNIAWVTSLLNLLLIPTLPMTPMLILYGTVLPWYVIIFCDACITSGTVWLINTVQEAFERGNNYGQGDE